MLESLLMLLVHVVICSIFLCVGSVMLACCPGKLSIIGARAAGLSCVVAIATLVLTTAVTLAGAFIDYMPTMMAVFDMYIK
jgi:hypothetical protein